MTGKIRAFLLMCAAVLLLPVMSVSAADNNMSATVGCASAMYRYYQAVENGERELYHEKTAEEIKDEAKQAALDTYKNLGIVSIGSGYLNVRKKADQRGFVIGKMLDGYAGEILKEEGDWYLISSGDVEGYVSKEFVLTGDEAREKALKVMDLGVQITTETLNVRTGPSEDAKMWTQVNELERYSVIGDLGDWIKIELDTSSGYVSSEYVDVKYSLEKAIEVKETDEEYKNSVRQDIVENAMQYLGNPYVWGGESLTKGCDCSGFVMLIYREYGIDLPHYSGDQAEYGKSITSDEMKPGDLVFYAGSNGVIDHVTMYIGNGQVIGAQSRRSGIRIRTWNYRTPVKIVSLLG